MIRLTQNQIQQKIEFINQYLHAENAATASRIIRDALDEKAIKEDDPENKSRKFKYYLPFWA